MSLQPGSRRLRTAAVGAVCVGLLAAGCGSSNGGSSGGGDSGTLIVFTGQAGDYQRNFNPYSPTLNEGPGTIFEPLFFYNIAQQEEPQPRLGTEFSWNDDGTELTITLREGVTWSDGEPFTAEDVTFTFDMLAAHDEINTVGYAGEAEAVNDHEVRVTFDKPSYMDGPQLLGKVWIVPEHIWSGIEDPATDPVNNPVGTGPYLLADFKAQAFTLQANPTYWDGEPELQRVRYLALSGNQAGADALAAGQIDWQTGPVPNLENVEEAYPGYQASTVYAFQMHLTACSSEELGCEGPQTDPAVRRALYYAIDREQLNALAFQNTAGPMSPGYALPERDAGYVSDELQERTVPMHADTERAQQILEDAGYTRGGDGIYARDGEKVSLTVGVPSGWTDYITAVNTMREQVSEAGIELTVEQSSWNEWSDARSRGDFELQLDSQYPGPSPDPYWNYNYFFNSDNTAPVGEQANPNWARYASPEVDAAIEELRQLDPTDLEARRPYYDAIQARIEADMPYVPVLTGGTTSEYNAEKFSGWPTEDNLYAYPAVWQRPDQAEIFKQLTPNGG
ncbi:ABC transporter substrate-binding protein [Streptomyces sp. 7-21]|uniref:ABC transporter substrate-binding protein n=1 Tax=Streptomyces sp. 7-21 TaxID=2802283 RepID=UPI00191E808F|nr:ABC transporter substrate-binding protein [Streptomyces sp. 7-21]MBL1068761.1 ABC transporter substrate-binding protein [Streptomyces sp. 7-21]